MGGYPIEDGLAMFIFFYVYIYIHMYIHIVKGLGFGALLGHILIVP